MVDKAAGEFRYRLIGTAIVRDLGRDLTGKPIHAHIGSASQAAAAAQALSERAFANAQPLFVTAHHATGHGTIHNSSGLLLSLSDDGRHVNMFIATRAACFNGNVGASRNWLETAGLKLLDAIDIHNAPDLEKRCRDWKDVCLADGPP